MLSDSLGIERTINEILKDDGHLTLDNCNYVSELFAYELPKHFVILEKEDDDV